MDYSEATAVLIDKEVHQIATGAYQRARNLLEERRDTLKKIAMTLLEREVLDGDEIDALIRGEDLPARPPARTPPPASEPATDSSTAEDRPQPPFSKPLEQPS